MRYEGSVYRPPSEAHSLIVQVTIGCAHNGCTFCGMFKAKKFRVRKIEDVLEDFETARARYKQVPRIFLADGDALVLTNDKLAIILDHIAALFPECERVAIYGSPRDALRRSVAELETLREKGVQIIYIGAESGSDKILAQVNKGATREEIIEAVQKIEAAGIQASVTFISGLGGKTDWQEHAIESGTMISRMAPSYVGLLTLMTDPAAPLSRQVREGTFKLLSPEEVVAETALLLEHIDVDKTCVFRSNHASNYVSLRGDLPTDKDRMLSQLRAATTGAGGLKDERLRML